MQPVVNAVIDHAVALASERTGRDGVIRAILGGLRQIRSLADEQGGPTVAGVVDAAVRGAIVSDVLKSWSGDGRQPASIPLPKAPERPGEGDRVAALVVEDAVASCLALNAHTTDNAVMQFCLSRLMTRLTQTLGGVPDWSAVLEDMRRPMDGPSPETSAHRLLEGFLVH